MHLRSTVGVRILAVAAGAAVVVPVSAQAVTIEVSETEITSTAVAYETTPMVGADATSAMVVYTTRDASGSPLGPGDIYLQRVGGAGGLLGSPVRLSNDDASDPTDDELSDIHGSRIVYTAFESTTSFDGVIEVVDISVDPFERNSIATGMNVFEARIHDDCVVFVTGNPGSTVVQFVDLTWPDLTPVTISNTGATSVEIGSDYVVWEERISGQQDIVVWHRGFGRLERVTDTAVDERNPSTAGTLVVFETRDTSTATTTIDMVDLSDDSASVLADNGALVRAPSIDLGFEAGIVAYETDLNGDFDIYVYRLLDGTTHQLTSSADDQVINSVFIDKVAFANMRADGSDGGSDVHLAVFDFDPCAFEILSPNGGEQWVAGQPATVRWLGHDVADLAISFDGGVVWSTLVSGVGGQAVNEHSLVSPGPATELARVRVSCASQPVSQSTSDASDGVFRIVLPADPPAAAHRLQLAPTGEAADERFGISVGTAGDVNGDGFADVVVGATQNDAGGEDAGRAYLYHGGPLADATADLVLTGEAAGDLFGSSVGTAGDVNGDGFADVVVGAIFGGAGPGRAYVYHGGLGADATADLVLTGEAASDRFGISVGTAGDVNGDGFADVVVGANRNDAGGTNAGRAYVYHGGLGADATADLVLTGEAVGDEFGLSVGTAGDVNGDGFADVIVGANLNDAGGMEAGRAYVYHGGPLADATADLVLTGKAAGDQFGLSVGTAGDVNGDGFADVVVGAYLNSAGGTNAGRAYVYHGGPGVDATADLVLTGEAAGDFFGFSVGTAGDVNGDGFADVVVGAHTNDASDANAGRAYVYYGGPVADATADLVLTGEAAGDFFGFSVGTAGDVNGDGFADIVVGADFSDAGGTNAGRAYVYDCNRYFVLSPNGGETWNVGAVETISWLGAEPADVWLSVDGGANHELLRNGVGGHVTNSIQVQVPHRPGRFSKIRVAPSDASLGGEDQSDSLFTIETSVALLMLKAEPQAEGSGLVVSWETDPGAADLEGYRLEKRRGEGAWLALVARTTSTQYHDPDGTSGDRYRLYAINGLGDELYLGETGADEAAFLAGPLVAYPLPYRSGDLTILFRAHRLNGIPLPTRVAVYDVSGRRVRTVADRPFSTAVGRVTWDGRDERGTRVSSGVYFVRVQDRLDHFAKRILVVR